MPVVVVANPKGGVGKSTLATHIAGYFASRGHTVMLGDADIQQSSRLWLGLRPAAARPIATWSVSADLIAKPPKGTTHVVLRSDVGRCGYPAVLTLVAGLAPGGRTSHRHLERERRPDRQTAQRHDPCGAPI